MGRSPTGAAGAQPHARISADPGPLQQVKQTSAEQHRGSASLKGTGSGALASHFRTGSRRSRDISRQRAFSPRRGSTRVSSPPLIRPPTPPLPAACAGSWGRNFSMDCLALARTRLLKPLVLFKVRLALKIRLRRR